MVRRQRVARENIFGPHLRVFKKKLVAKLEKAQEIVVERMRQNASLTDHTLKDLAAMGHPYSLRNSANPHDPPYLIHEQTGNLKEHIESEGSPKNFSFRIGVDEKAVPYLPYLILGTSKMIPRDFITESFNEVLPDLLKLFQE